MIHSRVSERKLKWEIEERKEQKEMEPKFCLPPKEIKMP